MLVYHPCGTGEALCVSMSSALYNSLIGITGSLQIRAGCQQSTLKPQKQETSFYGLQVKTAADQTRVG